MSDACAVLRGLYVVPNLGVLRAPRHILPEIDPLLIVVHIVEVADLHFIRES